MDFRKMIKQMFYVSCSFYYYILIHTLQIFLNLPRGYCGVNDCTLLTIFQSVMLNLKETIKIVQIQKLANQSVCN